MSYEKDIFDKYIPLFGMKDDYRIRYMIHKYNNEYKVHHPHDVKYNYDSFPTGLTINPKFIDSIKTDAYALNEWGYLFDNIICYIICVSTGNTTVFNTIMEHYPTKPDKFTVTEAQSLRNSILKKLDNDCIDDKRFCIIKKILNTLFKVRVSGVVESFLNGSGNISENVYTNEWVVFSLYEFYHDFKYTHKTCQYYTENHFKYYKEEGYIADRLTESMRTTSKEERVSSMLDDKKRDELEEQIYYRQNPGGKIYNSSTTPNKLEDFHKFAEGELCTNVIKDADPDECRQYLLKCLIGKGIPKCKQFLINSTFWGKTREEIRNMNPELALETLKAFGFKKKKEYDDVAKRFLYKVIQVELWLQNMRKETPVTDLSDPEYKNIVDNNNLKKYLNMVVIKVNANPTILNPEYLGASAEQMPGIPTYRPYNNRFRNMGIPLTYKRMNSFQLDGIRAALEPRFIIRTGMPFRMRGGGDVVEEKAKMGKYAHALLYQQYVSLLHALRRHGKTISNADSETISKLLTQLQRTEEKLSNAISYIEKYSNLVNNQPSQNFEETVSLDDMEQILSKQKVYFTRVEKQQTNLVSIMQSILLALSDKTKLPKAPSMPTPPPMTESELLPL